ncbi:MAG: hypothetical protein K1X89_16455 [Myxococcaceae bacterium]|nr:hypothetical protein [Myxococcaceae bacterium]
MRPVALALLAAALTGCPSKTVQPPDPDAGPGDFVGRSCNVDAECGDLRCDTVRHQCICLNDDSCKSSDPMAPKKYCNNYTGLCVENIAGCKSDSDCAMTEFCDVNTRACKVKKSFCETCSSDQECGGPSDNCIVDDKTDAGTKYCGKSCTVNADCARGAACVDKGGTKQCWPDKSPVAGQVASCKNFQGCAPDSLRTCNSNAECGDPLQRCDPARGKCIAAQQVCPFGTTCDPRNKICVADCAVDADCGDPKLRCNNRICEAIGECTDDLGCPANKVCNVAPGQTAGQCVAFCATDSNCPIGQACTKVGDRYKCQPGCTTTANCALDQRCNQTTKQCEGPLVGNVRVCQATPSCGSCQLCNSKNNECVNARTACDAGTGCFPHCQPCSGNDQCTGGTCVNLGLPDGGPDSAQYCVRYCSSGQECPQGFNCLGLTTGQSACVPSDRQCSGKCP